MEKSSAHPGTRKGLVGQRQQQWREMSGNKTLGKALFTRADGTGINHHTMFGLKPQGRRSKAQCRCGDLVWWKNKPQKPAIPAGVNLPIPGFFCTQRVVKLWKRDPREVEVFKNHVNVALYDVVQWAWE